MKALFHCYYILKVTDPNAGVNFLLGHTPLGIKAFFYDGFLY